MTTRPVPPVDGGAVGATVEQVFRESRSTVLATLVRHVGDLGLAEDAVQDAFASAVATWPRDGVPDNPVAWITVAARRKAVDRLRRTRSLADRTQRLAELAHLDAQGADPAHGPVADDQLRLVFTCCHPALSLESRVALTLRTIGGLSTSEIAQALLVSEPTMAQRISRAKRRIRDTNIPYRIPAAAELPERLAGVLAVVYLIFNEGYSATADDRLVRPDLCAEAIRLGRLLSQLLPREPEVWGLLGLMLLHHSRRDARVDRHGGYVALDRQDRSRWDAEDIGRGTAALRRALRLRQTGPYQVQAAIAALHAEARSAEQTDWRQIAELYRALAVLSPSPVVEINRAVAVGFAEGPRAGLEVLAPFLLDPQLARYQPLHAAHAELLRLCGDAEAAGAAYDRAIDLSTNSVQAAELRRRKQAMTGTDP